MNQSHLPIHPSLRHPRTGKPIQAVGLRDNGLPIWPIMGASPDDINLDSWTEKFGDKTPDQVQKELDDALAKVSESGGSDDSEWTKTFGDKKPEEIKEAVDQSRKWETRAKGNKDKADQYDALAKLITGKDDDKPDADKLAGDLTAAQRDARATKVENAVLKSATKHDADPTRLSDSRSFMSSIADLDPSEDDFATKLDTAIKKAVEDDESFKVTTATTSTGPRPARQQGRPSEGQQQGSVKTGAQLYEERHGKKSSS